jgi:ABC-type branched-subunit amino acid transport system substrate-binding protein
MIAGLCVFVLALTASEQRGREIYRHGTTASGRAITAVIGKGETAELPASVLACGSCHGAEGRGVPEGTIEPADIRGSTLANILVPKSPATAGARRRPRYDDALLARAIVEGRDSGDLPLSPIMPRYRMDRRDLADLLAYLHRLGDEPQPGRTADALTVTTMVPLSGSRAPTGALTRHVIESYFADVNAQGGLHGRTLRLRTIDTAAPDATQQATEQLRGQDVFAIVCASLAELDPSVRSLIDRERIPLVTPLPSDSASDATAPSSFFLFSDLESQALALARHVGAGRRNVHLVRGRSPAAAAAASAVEERAASLQWNLRTDGEQRDDDLLFLIGVDADDALRSLASSSWRPEIAIAGAQLTTLPAYPKKILLAVPTVPTDLTADGKRELLAFARRHQLPPTQLPTQIATYAAVKTFVEGLKRAGRELTREALIGRLETFYQFPTNLTPPLTYARNRHVGTTGAFILGVEKQTFVAASGWLSAE